MGRHTQLLYSVSSFEEKETDNSIDIDQINTQLLGWRITCEGFEPIRLVPNVDEYRNLLYGHQNLRWSHIDTHSSMDHICKFGGYYLTDHGVEFPFIEENVLENLAKVLKTNFVSGDAVFVINDSLNDAVFNYIIRIVLKDRKVKICIEIMDFMASMATIRMDLNY
jgi:hypothetical protein